MADQRCRREWFEQEKRRQLAFHEANPELSAFDPDMPWNNVFKAAARAPEFWKDNLEEAAILVRMDAPRGDRGRSRSPRKGKGGDRASGTDSKGKGKGVDAQRADGRYFKTRDGKQLCYDFNRKPDGCAAVCKNKRAHNCELCRGSHRAIRCPTRPGWTPPAQEAQPHR